MRCNIFLIKEGFLSLSFYIHSFQQQIYISPPHFSFRTSNIYIYIISFKEKSKFFTFSKTEEDLIYGRTIRSDEAQCNEFHANIPQFSIFISPVTVARISTLSVFLSLEESKISRQQTGRARERKRLVLLILKGASNEYVFSYIISRCRQGVKETRSFESMDGNGKRVFSKPFVVFEAKHGNDR